MKMNTDYCDGSGKCLSQDGRGGYQKTDTCTKECVPVACPNSELCGNALPAWVYGRHGGVCVTCAVTFGQSRLKRVAAPCEICMNDDQSCLLFEIRCGHAFCGPCLRRVCFDEPYSDRDIETKLAAQLKVNLVYDVDHTDDASCSTYSGEESDDVHVPWCGKCPFCRKNTSPWVMH